MLNWPAVTPSIQSLILGITQGLGEFLPISSSAHLILLPRFMQWPDQGLAFDVALHLGTLLAVLVYFWKDLIQLSMAWLQPKNPVRAPDRRLGLQVLIATVPGAVAGLLLEHRVETVFRSPHLIGWTLIVLGTLLALADTLGRGDRTLGNLSWGMAAGIGAAQALALIPGVSRSGITITTALFLGMERRSAARFSFLMSIPIIAGAGVLKFKEIWASPDHVALAWGFLGAALSGFFAIWALLKYVQKNRYIPFSVYRWGLGAFVLLNLGRFQ